MAKVNRYQGIFLSMQSGPSSEQPKVLHIGGISLHHVFQAHPKWMSYNIFPFLAGASNTVQIQACVFFPLSKWSLLVPSVAISFLFNGMHYSIISINNQVMSLYQHPSASQELLFKGRMVVGIRKYALTAKS